MVAAGAGTLSVSAALPFAKFFTRRESSLPVGEQTIAVDSCRLGVRQRRTGRIVSPVKILCITADRDAQPVQVEVGIARPASDPRST